MADIIQLLPDSIANQIAAGEVIQRPASVVKELLENSIDAGATEIKLIVKDAGKTLVQVIDNGSGMSDTDARMCFERHATSKIRAAADLFSIRSMGFRGEAMASIAAVAQVEMRTRRREEDLGIRLVIEGSEVRTHEACQCTVGTNLSIKNLFFNVPARRNFLKSNAVEMRHILEEFQRIALAHETVFFSLHHNGQEIFHLPAGNVRQRIVAVFGNNANKKLVPIEEETDFLRIQGFVGKPEFAKKTRGEQYFFVNNRFIKSGYLNHAVFTAYEEMLPKDTYPLYVIFLDIDPARIDINVHPTKQEIKFEDEKLIYNYLKVAVRHSLGQYSITPMLDFDSEAGINPAMGFGNNGRGMYERGTKNRPAFTGGGESKSDSGGSYYTVPSRANQDNNLKNWQSLYEDPENDSAKDTPDAPDSVTIASRMSADDEPDDESGTFSQQSIEPYQIHASYIVSQIKSGFLLIDQQAAHERILYEKYLAILENKTTLTQQELFPRTLTLSPADGDLLKELLPQINRLGFDIQQFGQTNFVINGVPADLGNNINEQRVIESLLEQAKADTDFNLNIGENIARSMARSAAIKRGKTLTGEEMRELTDKLFACAVPYRSPRGRNCFVTIDLEELESRFTE